MNETLIGWPSILAVLNLGAQAVTFHLPQSAEYLKLEGHGLAGGACEGILELPAFGAWFGMQK